MRLFYSVPRNSLVVALLVLTAVWCVFDSASISYGASPNYETQITPVNGAVTVERRPDIQWLVMPNGNQIQRVGLLLDGQTVPLQQFATGSAVALRYQPAFALAPGKHTVEYTLGFVGFQSITLSSTFIIAEREPDLYIGKDRLKLAAREAEALTILNQYRQTLGLPMLLKNKKLSSSAQAHANYITLNNMQGHYEQQSDPGFTGVRPQDRGSFFGYTGLVGEGISFARPVAGTGIDQLMDAPYHRLAHINPNFREAGIAFGWRPEHTIVDYGAPEDSNDDRVMLYPYPGQRDAKIAWFVTETPNPLARYGLDQVTVGYPISFSVHDNKTVELKMQSATLSDEYGHNIPCYVVDSAQETDHKSHVFLIPVQPLMPGRTYTAAVSGSRLQKEGTAIAVSRTWSFSTQAELAIRYIGVVTLTNGEYLEIITQNGDLPDLTYTLSKNGTKVRSYSDRKYYAYGGAVLEDGEYSLEISSSYFSQKLNYKVRISGVGEERSVAILN